MHAGSISADHVASADAGPGVEPGAAAWHRGWLRVAIALAFAGQGMAFGLAVNQTPPDTPGTFWVLHGGLAVSAVIVFALLGGPLVRECGSALRQGRITVDMLFLVSLLGAFAVSVFSTARREGPVFYELVAILLAIYTVGKLLGARSRARALRAVEQLRAEHATCLRLGPDGQRERVQASEVCFGDRVVVVAGEVVAVDGVVRAGRGLVWTTPLTGEPDPALRGPHDMLLAGMRSVDGAFEIEVTAAAGARRLDAMLRAIEHTRLAPSRLQSAVDRLASRFVPVVLLVGFGTFVFWLWRGTMVEAVENSLAVLVVACPCALGLATPLGLWSALVGLGRLGIVARSGDFVEALATADVAFFDKTGTLCEPALRVTAFTVLPACPVSEPALCAMIATAEGGVDHPIATALCVAVAERGSASSNYGLVEARVVPGAGLRARVRDAANGRVHEVMAGSGRMLAEAGLLTEEMVPGQRPADHLRRIFVAIDDVVAAMVELSEHPRARAEGMFAALRTLGLRVEILTGDPGFSPDVWPDVTRATGLAPEDKVAHIRRAQEDGERVVFVGDGLNDAPALAAADVAIALRHGAELARSNALAVVGGENLGTLPAAVRLARDVRTAIRTNLRFAVYYNAAAMTLAAAGLVHPVLAALLMAGSSLIVSARVLHAGSPERVAGFA